MSAHVLLNLLNVLLEKYTMRGKAVVWLLDSIYHIFYAVL